MKVIETHYKNCKFRSRLEARWAVFFDALRIEWLYEPEGYEMFDGTRYLPDFYLPRFNRGIYAEVKPDRGTSAKAIQFAEMEGRDVLLLDGLPAVKIYTLYADIGRLPVTFMSKYLPG